MMPVRFYEECPGGAVIKYAVITARYHGKWVLCRHRERTTWEIPGGHVEKDETTNRAASRELWEETGASEAKLYPICTYAVEDYGMLYYADIIEIGPIPTGSEIAEIAYFDALPDQLTYPHIQPALFNKVQKWLQTQGIE